MKTYSVSILSDKGYWVTNWGQYQSKGEIDFDKVKAYCLKHGKLAYGVMHGHKSRDLVSPRCRELLWINKAALPDGIAPEAVTNKDLIGANDFTKGEVNYETY